MKTGLRVALLLCTGTLVIGYALYSLRNARRDQDIEGWYDE